MSQVPKQTLIKIDSADTEFSFDLPSSSHRIDFHNRSSNELRFYTSSSSSDFSQKSGTDIYRTIQGNENFELVGSFGQGSTDTVFFQSTSTVTVVEITWTEEKNSQ